MSEPIFEQPKARVKFYVTDDESGAVLRVGESATEATALAQATPGESVHIGEPGEALTMGRQITDPGALKIHNDAQVKSEAGRAILKDYPIHAQLNAIARALEIIEAAIDLTGISAEDAAALTEVKTIRAEISAIRGESQSARDAGLTPGDFIAALAARAGVKT